MDRSIIGEAASVATLIVGAALAYPIVAPLDAYAGDLTIRAAGEDIAIGGALALLLAAAFVAGMVGAFRKFDRWLDRRATRRAREPWGF